MKLNEKIKREFFEKEIYKSFDVRLLDKINVNIVKRYNCFFLEKFIWNARYEEFTFTDHVGYENFVNKFYVDYHIKRNYVKASFSYVVNATYYWKMKLGKRIISYISTDMSLNRKFVRCSIYIDRKNEIYIDWNDDLEKFKSNGILMLSSDDIIDKYVGPYKKWIPPYDLLTEKVRREIEEESSLWHSQQTS